MPILKAISAPNGAAVAFHKALQASLDTTTGRVSVNVGSWSTEAEFAAGKGLIWMWPMDMAEAALSDLDAALVLVAPFESGTIASDQSQSLAAVQVRQCADLGAAYAVAIAQPVSFTTSAGVSQIYQSDPQSIKNCSSAMLGLQAARATPTGFYWVAADNTRVPFTFADLEGLAAALMAQGWRMFDKLQTLKSQVRAATTNDQVRGVTWASIS